MILNTVERRTDAAHLGRRDIDGRLQGSETVTDQDDLDIRKDKDPHRIVHDDDVHLPAVPRPSKTRVSIHVWSTIKLN